MDRPPRRIGRRLATLFVIVTLLVGLCGAGIYLGITHVPRFYREAQAEAGPQRVEEAKRFVARGLQLRNDITNESRWEATFAQEEVNAWFAEDLVRQFADLLPPGVSEPRIAFEADKVMLAFAYDRSDFSSIVWVQASVQVASDNLLELTIEKIRAGLIPMDAEKVLDQIIAHGREEGLDLIAQENSEGQPVLQVAYAPSLDGTNIILESIRLLPGYIHLRGRSDRSGTRLTLPGGQTLRATFSQIKDQSAPSSENRSETDSAGTKPSESADRT